MNCLLGDAGIAIGLTSLPFRQEREFYENEIAKSLFPNYREAVRNNFSQLTSPSLSDFDKYFYQPVPYYLFGSFDMAVLTVVDDFEMMARTFRAFDPMLSSAAKKSYRENFFYKVITGPTPQFKPDDRMVQIAARTFLTEERAPLFAMSLLKLNNVLLLGNGTELLRTVIRFIHAVAKRQNAERKNMHWILLESYAANEITLLVFTSSYSAAAELITTVREARMRDLLQSGNKVLSEEEGTRLRQNCMLADLTASGFTSADVLDASLFIDTESYFGFDFRLLNPIHRSLLERIDSDDSMDLLCQWSVRPGYLQSSIHELRNDSEVTTCVGRGDLFERAKGLSTRNMIQQVLDSLEPDSPPRHARRRQTMPAMAETVVHSLGINEPLQREYIEADLGLMCFSVANITEIQNRLRAVWAPKILTAKVLNAFTNFNDGILDPALYGYFIELLPLMELIQKTVVEWEKPQDKADLGLICATLEKVTDNFERAYRNRFYNSYRMGDITDFNLDFKGGIQQLISSFDAAYKAICSELGRPESFVYVAGSPGVYSTRYEVRLNYYHVFQPEIFASIANHEAANFYFTRFTESPPPFASACELAAAQTSSVRDKTSGSVLRKLDEMRSSSNAKQRTLLRFVTQPLFNYVFVDLLALYFGYNRNGRLWSYWYWAYFAQNSDAYSRAGKVDEQQIVNFMLRMLWIQRIAQVDETESIKFGMEVFDNLFCAWQPILNRFLDWLWTEHELSSWNTEVVAYVESKFRAMYQSSENETIDQITQRLEQGAVELWTKLERGETCQYFRKDDKSSFKFTEQILYAYLSLIKDRFGDGDILLDRSDDGHPTIRPSSAKALFDPIGGIFTHDPRTRRERFRYRAGLTMSLWDMAEKEKKRAVLTRLKRTD